RYRKIHSYYLSNSDKKLQLYDKNLNNEELYENESEYLESLILNIADLVDLMLTECLASGDAIFSLESVTNN
ncbi:3282_t:CDS:2, partial [Cetraspora pellucida]